MNLSDVKNIQIPEGSVVKIHQTQTGVVLWEKEQKEYWVTASYAPRSTTSYTLLCNTFEDVEEVYVNGVLQENFPYRWKFASTTTQKVKYKLKSNYFNLRKMFGTSRTDNDSNITQLTAIVIGENVTNIELFASSTNYLWAKNIQVEDNNPKYRNTGKGIVDKATNTLLTAAPYAVIDESVSAVGDNAFSYFMYKSSSTSTLLNDKSEYVAYTFEGKNRTITLGSYIMTNVNVSKINMYPYVSDNDNTYQYIADSTSSATRVFHIPTGRSVSSTSRIKTILKDQKGWTICADL